MAGPSASNNPDAFVGRAILSAYEPYPLISSTAYSSNAPASWNFIPWNQPTPINVSNIVVVNSMNAIAASATSQNSSGTDLYSYQLGATLFSRQDYTANTSNLSALATASLGISGGLTYSSGSQSFGLSWVTDTTGGTTSFSTTSGAANWSSYATGPKMLSIPFVTKLTAGEYWLAFQHSSTTLTTGSNITLLSMSQLHQAWPVISVGSLGSSATIASWSPGELGIGVASAVTTNATMAMSVISQATQNLIYFALSDV